MFYRPDFWSNVLGDTPKENDAAFKTLPEFIRRSISRTRWLGRFSTPVSSGRIPCANISRSSTGMDRAIGQVVAALEQTDQADTQYHRPVHQRQWLLFWETTLDYPTSSTDTRPPFGSR